MLPREVRGRFFQERVLHLELAVAAFQFPYPLAVRHIRWQRIRGMLAAVLLHPESEGGIVDPDFPGHLGYCPRRSGFDHYLGGLLLKLRSVSSRLPWHSVPSFP